jgi:hypothetical protein
MGRHRIYYKEEGGGFPQVQVVVSFVNPSLLVVSPNTKSAQYALTNLLFGFVQVCGSE